MFGPRGLSGGIPRCHLWKEETGGNRDGDDHGGLGIEHGTSEKTATSPIYRLRRQG